MTYRALISLQTQAHLCTDDIHDGLPQSYCPGTVNF